MSVNTVDLAGHQPTSPLGLLLAPLISRRSPLESHYTILIGWTRPYNKLGIVQKSGQIRIGDRLVEINGISVRTWTFEKIIRVLKCFDEGVRIRSLGFELLHDEIGIENRTFVWSVARRRLYSFSCFIRGYRHDQGCDGDNDNVGNDNGNDDDNGNGDGDREESESIVRYEVHCELVIRHYQGYDETIKFSVWKRFSDFKELHQILKEKFQWQMDGLNQKGLKFPSNKVLQSIIYGPASERFMDGRRHELQDYWSTLQTCSQLFDFGDPNSHRYAHDIALFLDVEKHLHSPDIPDSTASMSRNGNGNMKRNQSDDLKEGNMSAREGASSNNPGLDLNMSAISDIPMSASTELNLDESSSQIGEILVPSSHGLSPMARSAQRTRSGIKKRRKKVSAKPAYQRKLLDDM
jgi:hypothetical protein